MRSPIRWFGGKGSMTAKLLKLVPPHRVYVEPFGGGGSLLFAKKPAPVEVYNDIDSSLVNFFRVLRDPEKFERFHRLVSLTPYSREEYYFCRETWENCEDDVERAYRWFVVARMSFSGCFGRSWSFSLTQSSRGMARACSSWLSTIDLLPQIHARLMQVQIEHRDFREIFAIYDTTETLFYVDPPYVPDTRRSGKYKHELTLDDHKELVEILLNLKGMAILSGYRHPVYEPLEQAGWQRHDFETACYAAARTRGTRILGEGAAKRMQPRVESVWVSPNCEEKLAASR
ncbi:MAG: DNA adenine methylase [Armatimonadota bacterium]